MPSAPVCIVAEKNNPHGLPSRYGQAFFRTVGGSAESQSRFDPPGSAQGTPPPGGCLCKFPAEPDRPVLAGCLR